MIRILHFLYKRLHALVEKVKSKDPEHKFSKPIISNQEANDTIKSLINSGKPFMVSRFGATELSCVMNYLAFNKARNSLKDKLILQVKQGRNGFWKGWSGEVKERIASLSGVFPATDIMLTRFTELMLAQIKEIDVLGIWNLEGEDELHRKYFSNATLIPLESIEPYYHKKPWSEGLKGKKVLVIHPFEESIIANYNNRQKLFKDDLLPEFELKTIKAVQSIAKHNSGFNNWFDAYDHMCAQISETDFDIAIIGAGAYGLPLAAFVKQMNKQAIHMGGPTQILFGIKGGRWDSRDFFKGLYNEYWTRPRPSEVPQNFKAVEDGCYW